MRTFQNTAGVTATPMQAGCTAALARSLSVSALYLSALGCTTAIPCFLNMPTNFALAQKLLILLHIRIFRATDHIWADQYKLRRKAKYLYLDIIITPARD
jgi:hypothetical protein